MSGASRDLNSEDSGGLRHHHHHHHHYYDGMQFVCHKAHHFKVYKSQMLTRLILVIVLQYIQILNLSVAHLKLVC